MHDDDNVVPIRYIKLLFSNCANLKVSNVDQFPPSIRALKSVSYLVKF